MAQEFDLGYVDTYGDNLGYYDTYGDNLGYYDTYGDNLGYYDTYGDNLGYYDTYGDNLGYYDTYGDNLGYYDTYGDNLGYYDSYGDNLGYYDTYGDNLGYYDTYDDYYYEEDYAFYEETVDDYYISDSYGAKYSSSAASFPKFSMPSFSGGFSGGSAPMKFSNMPSYTPSYPSYPVVQNQPTPISNNTTITTTNIDNSIRDSFNDNSVNVIGSFNNVDSNNTAVAIGGSTWGTVTPIASVTPGRTIAAVIPSYTSTYHAAPVYHTNPQYVALSQIPYTGFDLGPVGNAMYWMSLIGVAVAGAYLLVYYQGGARSFAGSFLRASKKQEEVEMPVLPTVATEKKEVSFSTKDTMRFTEKGIAIDRNF